MTFEQWMSIISLGISVLLLPLLSWITNRAKEKREELVTLFTTKLSELATDTKDRREDLIRRMNELDNHGKEKRAEIRESIKEVREEWERRQHDHQESVQNTVQRLIATIDDLLNRITKVEVQVSVFWRNLSIDAAKHLHQPHPEAWAMDKLLERWIDGVIQDEELDNLMERLEQKKDKDDGDKAERLQASLMYNAIKALHPERYAGPDERQQQRRAEHQQGGPQ